MNYLGFHKVIAIGLDLAFLKERKHTSVIYDDGGINIKQKEAYTFVKGAKWRRFADLQKFYTL